MDYILTEADGGVLHVEILPVPVVLIDSIPELEVGRPASLAIRVTNMAVQSLDAAVSGPNDEAISVTIEPEQMTEVLNSVFTVRFQPTQYGLYKVHKVTVEGTSLDDVQSTFIVKSGPTGDVRFQSALVKFAPLDDM